MENRAIKEIIREELKKLSELTWGQRLGYIWDYYKPLMAAVLVVIFLISMGVTIYQNKQIQRILSVYLINSNGFNIDQEKMTDEFAERIGGLEEKQELLIDTSIYLEETATQQGMASQVKLTTFVSVGEIDLMVVDAENFEKFQKLGYFADLSEILTQEQMERWKDRLIYLEAADEEEETAQAEAAETESETAQEKSSETEPGQMIPAGINLTDSPILQEYHAYSDETVYGGIMVNAANRELTCEFLSYLLEEK